MKEYHIKLKATCFAELTVQAKDEDDADKQVDDILENQYSRIYWQDDNDVELISIIETTPKSEQPK